MKYPDNLTKIEKQAIDELVMSLKDLYGNNLSRLLLYGSKARGDAVVDSDIDILLVLRKMVSGYDEIKKINTLVAPLCLKYDVLISAMPIQEERITASYKTIFVHNVLSEGLMLL